MLWVQYDQVKSLLFRSERLYISCVYRFKVELKFQSESKFLFRASTFSILKIFEHFEWQLEYAIENTTHIFILSCLVLYLDMLYFVSIYLIILLNIKMKSIIICTILSYIIRLYVIPKRNDLHISQKFRKKMLNDGYIKVWKF